MTRPILTYLQQCRLMPYLCAAMVLNHFSRSFFMDFVSVRIGRMLGDDSAEFAALGREMHALSCASKPLASWTARDAIQESRECCGGHGYFAGKFNNELYRMPSDMYVHTKVIPVDVRYTRILYAANIIYAATIKVQLTL